MTAADLDRALVNGFTSGQLDQAGEAALAEQVARLLPFHWALPNSATAALTTLLKHLGGQAALYAWLDRRPGRPRLVARAYRLVAVLDRISDRPAVVTALAELRAQAEPADLQGYLVPDTTGETLASLAEQIESLLAEDPLDEALRVALATVDMLRRLAPRAAERDPELSDLGHELEEIRHDLIETSIQDVAGR